MSACIQAEDILVELRLIRALIVANYYMEKTSDVGAMEDVVEEKKEESATDVSEPEQKVDYEEHVPAWDIFDSDFDNFPALPVSVDESISFSPAILDKNFGVFNDFATTIVKLHDEHTIIFIGSAIGTVVVLTVICCFLVWFCCIRKCTGSYELQQINETEMEDKTNAVQGDDVSCASSTIESDSFQEGVDDIPQLDENMFDEIFEPRERKITEL
jgi:hypothetical protein